MERGWDNRRRSLPGSYSFTSEYPAQNERFGVYGVFEGKEQFDDISEVREYEICIPKPGVWCKGYYVDTVGKNTAAIKSYIANQLKQDQEMDQISLFDPRDPFTGSK